MVSRISFRSDADLVHEVRATLGGARLFVVGARRCSRAHELGRDVFAAQVTRQHAREPKYPARKSEQSLRDVSPTPQRPVLIGAPAPAPLPARAPALSIPCSLFPVPRSLFSLSHSSAFGRPALELLEITNGPPPSRTSGSRGSERPVLIGAPAPVPLPARAPAPALGIPCSLFPVPCSLFSLSHPSAFGRPALESVEITNSSGLPPFL